MHVPDGAPPYYSVLLRIISYGQITPFTNCPSIPLGFRPASPPSIFLLSFSLFLFFFFFFSQRHWVLLHYSIFLEIPP